MIWLLLLLLVGLRAFIALGVEDSRHHRAPDAHDET